MGDRLYRNGRIVDIDGVCKWTGQQADTLNHAASFSTLNTFIESRQDYRDFHHLGTRFKAVTKAMTFGRLYHLAVLEPEKFARIHAAPDFDRRKVPGLRALAAFEQGKDLALKPEGLNRRGALNKAAHDEWEDEHASHVILSKPEDFEDAQEYLAQLEETRGKETAPVVDLQRAEAIRDAVMAHPKARELLEACEHFERKVSWIDETGIEMNATPDGIGPTLALDLKGCMDPSPRAFTNDIESRGYYRQSAIYTVEAWRELYGEGDRKFWHIAVRNSEPYQVACYLMDSSWINDGIHEVWSALASLKECVETGDWREDYERGPQDCGWNFIERPAWAAAKALAFEEVA